MFVKDCVKKKLFTGMTQIVNKKTIRTGVENSQRKEGLVGVRERGGGGRSGSVKVLIRQATWGACILSSQFHTRVREMNDLNGHSRHRCLR